MRVLRLCSVFETPDAVVTRRGSRFDSIGGMQNHTASLSRALDRLDVLQQVITTRPPGSPRRQPLGADAEVVRLGLPVPLCRQLYVAAATSHLGQCCRSPGCAPGSSRRSGGRSSGGSSTARMP